MYTKKERSLLRYFLRTFDRKCKESIHYGKSYGIDTGSKVHSLDVSINKPFKTAQNRAPDKRGY